MDFKEFKEKCYGKTVDEIKEIINKEVGLKKIENIDIVVRAINTARQVLNLEHSIDFFYVFQKYFLIFINEIDLFLKVEDVPTLEDIDFVDYNITIEKILEENPSIELFKNLVEDIIKNAQYDVINELKIALEQTNISEDDLERAKTSLSNMFDGQSEERLKLIESILAYNDPNMKNIKDFIFDSKIDVKQEDEIKQEDDLKEKQDETIKAVENIKNTGEKISEKINSMDSVKAVNNQLQENQLKRVIEYKQQTDELLNNVNKK